MSELRAVPSSSLPAAAVEITAVTRAALDSARPARIIPIGIVAFVVGVLALGAALVIAGGATVGAADAGTLVAVGIAGTGALFALFVVLPMQLVARRRAESARADAARRDAAARSLRSHLASIGYRLPLATAIDWLEAPAPEATVPLVHDSVIAARWWQPAVGDERVFVEPYLRVGNTESTLPVLAPVPFED